MLNYFLTICGLWLWLHECVFGCFSTLLLYIHCQTLILLKIILLKIFHTYHIFQLLLKIDFASSQKAIYIPLM